MLIALGLVLFTTSSYAMLWLIKRNEVRDSGRENRRGSKIFEENLSIEDANGHPFQNWIILDVGGSSGNDCINQWHLSFLCLGEMLYLKLRENGSSIDIVNSYGRTIGFYPPNDGKYVEFVCRLQNQETINAWVFDWGANQRYYCEIKFEVYDYSAPAQLDETAPSHLPYTNTVASIKPSSSVVFFPTGNLTATTDFYCSTLNFTIYHQTPQSVIVDTGYGYLGFVAYGDSRPMATGICISLNCASRDEVYRLYNRIKKTYPVNDPPHRNAQFPVYSFFMSDPNGYTLEFQIIEE